MKLRSPWQVNLAKEIRLFATSPRQMYAEIPALITYAIWAIGLVWSGALQVTPIVPTTSRPFFIVGCTGFAYLFVFLWSKVILRRRNLIFWPFEYYGVLLIAMLPTLLTLATYLGNSTLDFISLSLRLIFLVSVAESIVGFLAFRITKRSSDLTTHQISLVDYEEKFLETVHNHLHDNVQTKLFGLGIQLNQIRNNVSPGDSEKIAVIISEIEKIRKSDVRDFGKEFTPQIATFGLVTALVKLFEAKADEIAGTVQDDTSPPLTSQENAVYGLGIYRIAEQVLINSVIHGKATRISLRIYRSRKKLKLRITNNGEPLKSGKLAQGHGFAVIDGWVSKLNGNWSIANSNNLVSLDFTFR